MCYAVGAKPLNKRLDILISRLVLNHFVDSITVRDGYSRQVLERAGVRRKVVVSADPAVSIENTSAKLRETRTDSPLVGACLKDYYHEDLADIRRYLNYETYIRNITNEFDSAVERSGCTFAMIPSNPADVGDMGKIRNAMNHKSRVVMCSTAFTPSAFMTLASTLDVLISQRLHPLILAGLLSVPVLAIPYSAKVRSYMEEIGAAEFCVEYSKLGTGELSERLQEVFARSGEMRMKASQALGALKVRAQVSVDVMKKLMAQVDRKK